MTQTPPGDSEQAFLDRAVVIALGSNLPGAYASSRELLDAALKALDAHGLSVVRASSWWRSKAWPEGSGPDFLNGVVLVETEISPREILVILQLIEKNFGRFRTKRNAPRTLDLDLIACGRLLNGEDDLILPHPRAIQRRFVLGPIKEIAPTWVHPVSHNSAIEAFDQAVIGIATSLE